MSAAARAQCSDDSPIEKVEPRATQISGASDVIFSPSGKSMIVQRSSDFYLLPTEHLDDDQANFKESRFSCWEGWAKGFLPSGKIVFAARRGLYAVDPSTKKTEPIYQITAAEEENGNYLIDGEIISVSENLIVSGDGDYDLGLKKGNILRFDVKRRSASRRAQIRGFQNPMLSPGGRYILYEHNGESGGNTDFYDINADRNHSIAVRFDFKRIFPQYKSTFERPIAWISPSRFLAEVDENQTAPADKYKADSKPWLILFDAEIGKIVWKRQTTFELIPPYFHQLSPTKALMENDGGVYEISLASGKSEMALPALDGKAISVSPDKKQIAYFDIKHLYISSLDGKNAKSILDLPYDWTGVSAYKDMGTLTPPLWSPDGKRLVIFDEKRVLFIRL
jgi:Tol biopolymer transport system component